MDEDAGFVAPVYKLIHTPSGPVLKQVRKLATDYAARIAPYLKKGKHAVIRDTTARFGKLNMQIRT